jgi:hypothetical protein
MYLVSCLLSVVEKKLPWILVLFLLKIIWYSYSICVVGNHKIIPLKGSVTQWTSCDLGNWFIQIELQESGYLPGVLLSQGSWDQDPGSWKWTCFVNWELSWGMIFIQLG